MTIPTLEAFAREIAPHAPGHRSLRRLHEVLTQSFEGSQEQRVEQVQRLFAWIRANAKVPAFPDGVAGEKTQVTRIRYLLSALETYEVYRSNLSRGLYLTFNECSGINFLACLGLPGDRGFMAETVERLSRRLLPEPVDSHSLTQLLGNLFPRPTDLKWIAVVPDALLIRSAKVLAEALEMKSCFSPLARATRDAVLLLSTRISAVGLSEAIRTRSPNTALHDSPFYQLPRAVDVFIAQCRAPNPDPGVIQEHARHCHGLIESCLQVAEIVVSNLEVRGVSIDVVYRIELITKSLEQLSRLLARLAAQDDGERYVGARDLMVRLLAARLSDRSVSAILRSNLHLLARKIIERAGHSGEHYITSTRGEYWKMLVSAGGGGFMTAGTATLKFFIGWGHFAPFVEGMFSAANYAGSFLLMQMLGLTLATKQPSMTAAALAGSLRQSAGHQDLTNLVALIARITRSQFAAAVGNIGLVIPAALGVDLLHRWVLSRPFLDATTATYVLKSLHPTESGTVFYAALTGVLLWMSSIGAGWLENWAVYHRLPEAIAEHRYGRYLGRSTMRSLARALSHNIGGFGGNTTLGFLLGMTPVMGKFMGLPLDVRHVTLSTGALALAVSSIGVHAVGVPALLWSAAGIAVIGLLNFGVSFVLALAVALRARDAASADQWRLLVSVVVTFFRSPFQFFLPPRSVAPKVHGPVSIHPRN